MSKPKIQEIEEKMARLVKKVEITEDTTDLIVDGLDINKDSGTWEIIFNGVIDSTNVVIIPNNTNLDLARCIMTQMYSNNGQESGSYSGNIRYTTSGLWLIRGVNGITNLTTGILKYNNVSNLCTLNCQSGSVGISDAMLCNMFSICRPIGANNITSLKFKGTIKAGATIEIYKK